MAGLPPPPFFYCSPSDSPLDVYSPPQALQGGGREEHHHRSSSTPLSPCLAFFLVPSHRSKRFNSKQQDSAPFRLFLRLTHPLKPGYNRQTPQQRPFCSAAVGDAGSVLHQGGSTPRQRRGGSPYDAAPPLREGESTPQTTPPFPPGNRTPPWSERQTRPTPSGLQPPSGTIPERNTERQHAPPCSSLSDALQHAAPADALLRNIPDGHIPLLTLGPLPPPKRGKTRGGCFEPRSGQTQTPLSSLNHPERLGL